MRVAIAGPVLMLCLAACGTPSSPVQPAPADPAPTTPSVVTPTTATTPSSSPTASPAPTRTTAKAPGLPDDEHNAYAFARLDEPDDITVVGQPATGPAYSTSKLLVVAAFLDTVHAGNPRRLSAAESRLVRASLQASDGDAVTTLRDRIPGSSGRAMTAILRSIGDRRTSAPDFYQGLMTWSLREQVRFMAALHDGRVVSKATSDYLLDVMRPIASQRWGLGTIGATSFKGGWLRRGTPTRQVGIVDGYAVAILTDTGGPALRQSDGDSADVRDLDALARALQKRLAWEEAHR